MPYRYALQKVDYTDYASGRVFFGAPGHPAFPIRLASEIFQACLTQRFQWGYHMPCVLYDPVCGGAYHLAVLAYLHWEAIWMIIGSDIDHEILKTAERNLGLLTLDGMDQRIKDIEAHVNAYGKKSHMTALESAIDLRYQLQKRLQQHHIDTNIFCSDVMETAALALNFKAVTADIVIADIPYGIHSSWQLKDTSIQNPVKNMLDSVLPILSKGAILAIAADKQATLSHPSYRRLERFQVGKRKVVLLSPTKET
jgi:hypothetical protein